MPEGEQDYQLEALERLAQDISPNLREAVAAIEVARGQAIQSGLYPNPTVNWGSPQWAGSISQYFQFLTQEIVVAGKLRLNRSAGFRAVDQAEFAFLRARFDLLTTVRATFYSALASQRKVAILEGLVEIARKSQESAVKLKRGGEGTQPDVLLLDIELERARVALLNAQAMLTAAKRQLAAAVGAPTLAIRSVQGDLLANLPEYQYDFVREGVLENNSNIAVAEIEIDRLRILLKRARVEPIPNIFLQGGYQWQVPTPDRNQGIFQISVPVPVYNRNQGNIRAARAGISRAAEALERLRNELAGQTADAVGRHLAFRQQVERYELQILPKAHETQDLAQKGYQQGQFDFLRLLAAQKTLVEANLNYISAQEGRWTTAAEIAGLLQTELFPPPLAEMVPKDNSIAPQSSPNPAQPPIGPGPAGQPPR